MQLVTKVAIGVGVVVAGLGAYYAVSGIGGVNTLPPAAVVEKPAPPTKALEAPRSPSRPPITVVDRTKPLPSPTFARTTQPSSITHTPSSMPAVAVGMRPETAVNEHIASNLLSSPPTPTSKPAVVERPAPAPTPVVTPALTPPIETGMLASPTAPKTPTPKPTVSPSDPIAATPTKAGKEYTVQAGDSFSSLAAKNYGHAKYANLIQNANPDKDPRKLRVGMKIVIPPGPEAAAGSAVAPSPAPTSIAPPTPSPTRTMTGNDKAAKAPSLLASRKLPDAEPAAAERAYTVQAGDNWEKLAKRFLGKNGNWTELYEHNKERLGGNSHNLRPGVVLELPEGADLQALNTPTTKPAAN
jgi:nucleoid-associated protein YgaU